MGRRQAKQPLLGKEGIAPAMMIRASTATPQAQSAAADAA
jgi:hypothetical protein